MLVCILFLNRPSTTQIYTLSLHDALPISGLRRREVRGQRSAGVGDERVARRRGDRGPALRPAAERVAGGGRRHDRHVGAARERSEEHTSELQSQSNLVCRLLLEKKKQTAN